MSLISDRLVPNEGPDDARVLLVGEAPGEDENDKLRPFIGRAGSFLERYLGRCGVQRDQVYLANLSNYQPRGNKFPLLHGTTHLSSSFQRLSDDIERVDPNIIIALGNWPMYFLTGATASKGEMGTGVSLWRGSIIQGMGGYIPAADGRKVGITYHPSFVMRPKGFGNHPIFLVDLRKFFADSTTKTLNYPVYESLIDPPNLEQIVGEMAEAEWLSVDIETFGDSMACIGFADSDRRGLCVTFENPFGWEPAANLLESRAKKIFQYGAFDINYLKHYYNFDTRAYAFDTYIATANLKPEFPRGLDFLTSIYTDFPFYKEERKVWKQTGSMKTLWEYNIKDCIATYMIAMQQMDELKELYKGRRVV